MKLITLNTWAGRVKKPFDDFLRTHMTDTDVFCFQEIYNHTDAEEVTLLESDEAGANKQILQEVVTILADFDCYFCPIVEHVYGIAIFVKKGFEQVGSGEILLHQSFEENIESGDHTRKMQWMHIKKDRKDFMVMNVHGHYDPQGTGDTEDGLTQSKTINDFIATTGAIPKILVGDFNLHPDTESITLLETHINTVDASNDKNPHTDYVFVSSEIFVEGFKVMPDVVSDHAPLLLQFDVF